MVSVAYYGNIKYYKKKRFAVCAFRQDALYDL